MSRPSAPAPTPNPCPLPPLPALPNVPDVAVLPPALRSFAEPIILIAGAQPLVAASPPAPRRRGVWLALLSGVVVIVIGVSLVLSRSGTAREETPPPAVTLAQRGPLEACVVEHGELESAEVAEVKNPIAVAPVKLNSLLPYGTKVKAGQTVARLDLEPLHALLLEQEAKRAAADGRQRDAQEALEMARSKQEGDLAAAQLQLDLAQMDLERYLKEEKQVELNERRGAIALAERDTREAEEKLAHYRTFHKRGFITAEQLKAKEAEVSRSRFSLTQSQARLQIFEKYLMPKQETQLKAKLDEVRRESCRTQKASLSAVAKAQLELTLASAGALAEGKKLDRLKQQLALAEVKAPRDGVLFAPAGEAAKVRPAVGTLVQPEQPLFVIPDLACLRVRVRLSEEAAGKLKPGAAARVCVEGEEGTPLAGAVEKVEFLADSPFGHSELEPKDFVACIALSAARPNGLLRPGQKSRVEIPIGQVADALQIPVPATAEKEGKRYAFIVRGAEVEPREIRPGASDGKSLEVCEGLAEGDSIALRPPAKWATK